jgi:hypothetical protein
LENLGKKKFHIEKKFKKIKKNLKIYI